MKDFKCNNCNYEWNHSDGMNDTCPMCWHINDDKEQKEDKE